MTMKKDGWGDMVDSDSDSQLPVKHQGFPGLNNEDVAVDSRIKLEENPASPVKTESKGEEDDKFNFNLKTNEDMKFDRGAMSFRTKEPNDDSKVDLNTASGSKVETAFSTLEVPMPCPALELPDIAVKDDPVETKPVPATPAENTPSSSGEGEIIESHVENNCESTFEDTVVVDVHMSSSDPEPMVKNELEEVIIPPRTPRLSKRRLCLMDAVVVPSLASLGIKRRRDVGEEIPTKLQVKKIKKLERSEGLEAGTLRARLISAGIGTEPYPIDLEGDVRNVFVRRDFMRLHYGGNGQAAFPAIAEKWYTKLGTAPGLFLDAAGRSARECDLEWTTRTYKVLTRLGTNDNLYMGEYVIQPANSLTRAEWRAQTPAMRNRWCNKLAKKDWGRITRTRIALRRQLGRNPTFEEVDAAIKGDQKFGYITADDIAQAFDNGEEQLEFGP
ncbi:hypothetical protein B0H13DRAFT_2660709 [Mycena leptocephala]|nr:hypothetical protein B0H13DRAFT_2660709 [Mycena leptocephala]